MKIKPLFFVLIFCTLITCASATSYTQTNTMNLTKGVIQTLTGSQTGSFNTVNIASLNVSITPTYNKTSPIDIPGLITWYKFDSKSGTTLVNSSGGSSGSETNGVWTTGKHDGGLYLNGSASPDSRGTIVDSLFNSSQGTCVIWVYKLASSGTSYSDCDGNTKTFFELGRDGAGNCNYYVGDTTGYTTKFLPGFTTNCWHMLSLSYNATTGIMGYALDTNYGSQSGLTYPIIGGKSGAHYSYLSLYYNGGGRQNATYDDLLFFNRSLTQTELNTLYYDGLKSLAINTNSNVTNVTTSTTGIVNVPYSSNDQNIASLSYSVPSTVTLNGVVITDYNNTITPFNATTDLESNQQFMPISSFTANVTNPYRNSPIQFTNTTTNLPTSLLWDFGDGSTDNRLNPVHTFSQSGTYTVSLTAINSIGSNTSTQIITVNPMIGDNGVINNSRKIVVYIPNTNNVYSPTGYSATSHDGWNDAFFHEYNLSYVFDDNIASLSKSNCDLLLVDSNFMCNASTQVINNYISSGGSVWFLNDPGGDEKNTYIANMTNATYNLPYNKFYCFGSLTQPNISASMTFTANTTNSATSMLPATFNPLFTTYRYQTCRYFGSTYGTNLYGYNYNELIYSGTNCCLAKIWNSTTGAKVIYSDPCLFGSGGTSCFFNASIAPKMFNNLKSWVLNLDNNSMQVSVTYPKGDKQFTETFDDESLLPTETAATRPFFNMIQSLPNPVGITLFIKPQFNNPTIGFAVPALNYYQSIPNVDCYTIHPHDAVSLAYDSTGYSVMNQNFSELVTDFHNGINDQNFPQYSERFQGTHGCNYSQLIMAQKGFKILSNYGGNGNMFQLGGYQLNDYAYQKQAILFENKTKIIEIECPVRYDLDECALWGRNENDVNNLSGALHFDTDNENASTLFLKSDFPGIYTMNGHWQCAMTQPNFLAPQLHFYNWLDDQNSYVAYTNFSRIALYEMALQNASIQINTIGSSTSAIVSTQTPITNFTVKLMNVTNGVHVQYDGQDVDAGNIIYEDGNYFVYHNIDVGTHNLTVIDESITGSYGLYIGKNSNTSLKIKSPITKVTNNLNRSIGITLDTPYVFSGINTITNNQNSIVLDGHTQETNIFNLTIAPDSGSTTVTGLSLNNSDVEFNETSGNGVNVVHSMNHLPIDKWYYIYKDDVAVKVLSVDNTGSLMWNDTGDGLTHKYDFYMTKNPIKNRPNAPIAIDRSLSGHTVVTFYPNSYYMFKFDRSNKLTTGSILKGVGWFDDNGGEYYAFSKNTTDITTSKRNNKYTSVRVTLPTGTIVYHGYNPYNNMFEDRAKKFTYMEQHNVNLTNSSTQNFFKTYVPINTTSINITVNPVYNKSSPADIPGLIRWYNFNNVSGTKLNDSNGTIYGNIVNGAWVRGKHDNGLYLNSGSANAVSNPVYNTGNFTIICWVNKTYTVANSAVYESNNGSMFSMNLAKESGGNALYELAYGNTYTSKSIAGYTNNVWHMVAMSYNNKTGTMGYCLDNRYYTQTGMSYPYIGNNAGTQYVYLGYEQLYATSMNAIFDDLMFFNRSLTQTELNNLYYDGLANLTANTNSNVTNSNTVNISGILNIPFGSLDANITSLTYNIPTNPIINGVTMNDYTNTTTPFTVISQVNTLESNGIFDVIDSVLNNARVIK